MQLNSICSNDCVGDFIAAWNQLYAGQGILLSIVYRFGAVCCLLWGVLTCNSSVSDDLPGSECLRTNGTALLNSSVEDRRMRQFIALGPLMVCCVYVMRMHHLIDV